MLRKQPPLLTLIAAVAQNGVIGDGIRIPWHLPSDLRFFKKRTMGKPVILGRKTLESLPGTLPGRYLVVVSHRTDLRLPDKAVVAQTPRMALEKAQEIAEELDVGEIMVAGGGEIYRQMLPFADQLCVTHLPFTAEGDVTFPEIDPEIWEEIECASFPITPQDPLLYTRCLYRRREGIL